jgi:hypothetical protein
VPLAIVASIVFALSPKLSPKTRFIIMATGTAGFVLASLIVPSL